MRCRISPGLSVRHAWHGSPDSGSHLGLAVLHGPWTTRALGGVLGVCHRPGKVVGWREGGDVAHVSWTMKQNIEVCFSGSDTHMEQGGSRRPLPAGRRPQPAAGPVLAVPAVGSFADAVA